MNNTLIRSMPMLACAVWLASCGGETAGEGSNAGNGNGNGNGSGTGNNSNGQQVVMGPGPNGEPANIPGANVWVDPGDGQDRGMVAQLELSPSGQITLEESLSSTLNAAGVFEDGSKVGLTEMVTWTSSDEQVVRLGTASAEGIAITAVSQGTSTIVAEIGTLRAEMPVDVTPPAAIGLSIAVAEPAVVGDVGRLTATAEYRGGETEDVTATATWSSSRPSSVQVLNDPARKGLIYTRNRQGATITATFMDQTATFEVAIPCAIGVTNGITQGNVMVNARWPAALVYDANGNRTVRALTVEDLMCDPAFDSYRAYAISLNAGWCRPCHAWMGFMSENAQAFEDAGILPIFVIGDDARNDGNYDLATTDYADTLVATHTTDPRGIRVGDADTENAPFPQSPRLSGIKQVLATTNAWPSRFIVRREDMRVLTITNTPRSVSGIIDVVDRNTSGGGGGPAPMTNCQTGDDELSEPNDIPRLAPVLTELGSNSGGICDRAYDYYRVRLNGAWRASVMFTNATADLDMYAWDEQTNAILAPREGQRTVSATTRNDFEYLDLEGEALIRIQAKVEGATAPYTLFLEAR